MNCILLFWSEGEMSVQIVRSNVRYFQSDSRPALSVARIFHVMVEFRPTESGVRFAVQVQPRASRTEIVGVHGDALKVRVAAPPVDGAANEELSRHLARQLGVAASAVQVVGGATGRRKIVEVDGITTDRARTRLLGKL